MIIQRISSNRAASGLYVFNNNNYNQAGSIPVNPVKPVKKLPGFESGEEQKRPAAIYQQNGSPDGIQAAGTKQIDSIKNEYMSSGKAEYNTSNMYERQRMATEGTVLIGMNIDTFA